MKPWKLAALAALTLASSTTAQAETDADVAYVFSTIDSVGNVAATVYGMTVAITGIVEGQPGPQTIKFANHPESHSCERLALMSFQRPGRYLFTINGTLQPVGVITSPKCNLARH